MITDAHRTKKIAPSQMRGGEEIIMSNFENERGKNKKRGTRTLDASKSCQKII